MFQSNDQCHGGTEILLNGTIGGCKPLVQKDYIDLLSTTMSEFPGNHFFFKIFLGLIITASIIEYLGRKKTMALEFGVYSFFVFLLFFCLERYICFDLIFMNFRRWVTTFIFVARAFISGSFQSVYVYTPEVSLIAYLLSFLGISYNSSRSWSWSIKFYG